MVTSKHSVYKVILAASLMWPAGNLLAQANSTGEEGSSMLEEVIVTARKREESLQEVPLTISVFSADDILKDDIRGLREVSDFTPGFQYTSQGGQETGRLNTQLKFRGMTTSQFSPSFATGALFIDGIYVLNGGTSLSLMDVQQVEVIKGPQAAYFGRNTFGGAVNLITRDPNMEEFAAEANVRVTDRSNNEANVFLEGPILPGKLSFSLGGRQYDKRGHYVANDGGRMGNEETTAINAVLKWEPTENLSFKARYGYSEDDDGPPHHAFISGSIYDTCTGKTVNSAEGMVNPKNYICGKVPYAPGVPGQPGTGEISSNTFIPHYFVAAQNRYLDEIYSGPTSTLPGIPRQNELGIKRETERFSLFAAYDFDNGYAINANFGKNHQKTNYVHDFDLSDRIVWFARDPQDLEDESYEVRLTSPMDQRFRWLVGFNQYEQTFYGNGAGGDFSISCYGAQQTPANNDYPGNCVAGVPGAFVVYSPNTLENSDRADVRGFFGSIDFDITDEWTAIFEGRWQEDKITKGAGVNTPGAPILSETYTDFLPRVILRWQPTDTTNLFVSYSEGQIPGDFNAAFINSDARERAQLLAQEPGLNETLDAETLDAWEIGWKQGFAGGRGQANLSVYHYVWENIKGRSNYLVNETCRPANMGVNAECNPANGIQVGDPKQLPGPDGTLIPFYNTKNLLLPGDATINGAEVEVMYLFTDSLSGQVGVSYIDSKYDDYEFNFVRPVAGYSQMKGNSTPRQPKWSGFATMTWETILFDRESYLRGDWLYTGEQYVDESNLAYLDDYSIVNVRFGMNINDQWLAELFVSNLFDEEAWMSGARRTDFARPTQLALLTNFQGVNVVPLDKREIGLRVNFKF